MLQASDLSTRAAITPARLVRSLRFRAGRLLYPRYRRPIVVLFRYTRALGDNLMLTTVAREVRKRNPQAIIHVVTGLPELCDRNPDVSFGSAEPDRRVPQIGRYLVRYEHRFPWTRHLLHYCAECVDIHDEIELRPYVYPSEADRAFARDVVRAVGGAPILVARVAGPRTDKKNWPAAQWREAIPRLCDLAPVVDVGGASCPAAGIEHPRFHDLLGRTTVHQLAALMERSALLVAPVTGVVHLAAASGLRALTIVGGSEPAVATLYPGCLSLVSRPACADCYERGPCAADFACLRAVRARDVAEAAETMLAAEGRAR
jgi:ADP-heptose:LPS heptosyltransferase